MSTVTDPARLDDEDLRADRRRRLFAAMAEHDLDVLVLGRPAEVAFATGARQLWTAGSRPFGPACVAVRSTGHTHLLSVSDFDVPPEVGHDDLFGLSWNPAHLAADLGAIPGLATARRVGTTSSSPGFPRLLAAIAPGAELVDGSAALGAARSPKSAAEVASIVAATKIAEASLTAMVDALAPGVSERDLLAAYLERLSSLGAPTPPTEGVACATPTSGPVALRRLATRDPIAAGQLVVLDAGALHHGYEGGVGRTWVCSGAGVSAAQQAVAARCRAALDATIAACRAGATGADLCAAWTGTGESLPPVPLAHGIGLGVEPPVVGGGTGGGIGGGGIGGASVLAAGTVLAVTGWVAQPGAGGVLERDLVLVGDGAPEILTAYGRGPAGGSVTDG